MPWTVIDDEPREQSSGWRVVDDQTPSANPSRMIGQVAKAIPYTNPDIAVPSIATDVLGAITKPGAKLESIQELEDARDRGIISPEQFDKAKIAIESQDLSSLPLPTEALWQGVEAATGLPFVAQTPGEREVSIGAQTAAATPGGPGAKLVAGVTAPTISRVLQHLGLGEEWSNFLGMVLGGQTQNIAKVGQKLSSSQPKQLTQPPKPSSTPPPPPTAAMTEMVEPPPLPPEALEITPSGRTAMKVAEKVPSGIGEGPKNLGKRYLEVGGKDVGYRPADYYSKPPVAQQVYRQIAKPEAVENPTQGGHAFKSQIQENSREFRKGVNAAYKKSELLAGTTRGTVGPTTGAVQDIVENLERKDPLKLTVPEKKLLDNAKAVQKLIGTPEGMLDVSAQDLINEIQDIHKIRHYTFEHGDPYNIFAPLEHAVEQGTEELLSSNPKALQAWRHAKAKHAEWNYIFNNEYINPFRETKAENFEKLYSLPTEPDSYTAFERAMRVAGSKHGKELSQIAKAELVQRQLKKYIDNPILYKTPEFRKELDRLKYHLTPEELKKIESTIATEGKRPEYRKGKVTKAERIVPKIVREKPAKPEKPPTPKEKLTLENILKNPKNVKAILKGWKGIASRTKDIIIDIISDPEKADQYSELLSEIRKKEGRP